jgi:hypothetical protein
MITPSNENELAPQREAIQVRYLALFAVLGTCCSSPAPHQPMRNIWNGPPLVGIVINQETLGPSS